MNHGLGCLVVPQDQGVTGTGVVRALELRLEAAATGIEGQAQPGLLVAQLLRQLRRGGLGLGAEAAEIDMGRVAGNRRLLQGNQGDQALDAQAEPDARGGWAAELFDQPVIATAGTNRVLRAKLAGGPLEHRMRV